MVERRKKMELAEKERKEREEAERKDRQERRDKMELGLPPDLISKHL